MKKIILLVSFVFSASLAIGATTPKNLADFPKHWTGSAGDLVVRVPTSLTINSIEPVRQKSGELEYVIKGNFQFGQRSVPVYKAVITTNSSDTDTDTDTFAGSELALFIEDELVPAVFVMISLDKDKNEYVMKDLETPPAGRRLLLRAAIN